MSIIFRLQPAPGVEHNRCLAKTGAPGPADQKALPNVQPVHVGQCSIYRYTLTLLNTITSYYFLYAT